MKLKYEIAKSLAAGGPVIFWGVTLISIFWQSISHHYIYSSPLKHGRILSIMTITWVAIGTLFLMFDAFARNYTSPRVWPFALAILGLPSWGLSVAVYYFIWGVEPLLPKDLTYGTAFCSECMACSKDSRQIQPRTHKIFGLVYFGRSSRCVHCNSFIQTLWIVIVVPVIPLGSYRIVAHRAGELSTRRIPFRWGQAMKTAAIGWIAVVCFIAFLTR